MSLDPNSAALILELAKLGLAAVRRYREAHNEDVEAPLTVEDVSRIRIRGVDDLIAEGRARVHPEEPLKGD